MKKAPRSGRDRGTTWEFIHRHLWIRQESIVAGATCHTYDLRFTATRR